MTLSWGASDTNRRPSSNPAKSWETLASLSPRTRHNSENVARPNPANPLKRASRREDNASTFSPCRPVRSRIAISSVLFKWRSPLWPENARKVVDRLRTLDTAFIATFPRGSTKDYSQLPHWDLTRISALDLQESMAEELERWFSGDNGIQTVKAYLPYNGLWAVDSPHGGVNKGSGARQLARLLDVTTPEIAAAGDSHNDLAPNR